MRERKQATGERDGATSDGVFIAVTPWDRPRWVVAVSIKGGPAIFGSFGRRGVEQCFSRWHPLSTVVMLCAETPGFAPEYASRSDSQGANRKKERTTVRYVALTAGPGRRHLVNV